MKLIRRFLNLLRHKPEQTGHTSRLVIDDFDSLPLNGPVVTYSEKAIEMQSAVKRLHAERNAKQIEPVQGPRIGSLKWRIEQAKGKL